MFKNCTCPITVKCMEGLIKIHFTSFPVCCLQTLYLPWLSRAGEVFGWADPSSVLTCVPSKSSSVPSVYRLLWVFFPQGTGKKPNNQRCYRKMAAQGIAAQGVFVERVLSPFLRVTPFSLVCLASDSFPMKLTTGMAVVLSVRVSFRIPQNWDAFVSHLAPLGKERDVQQRNTRYRYEENYFQWWLEKQGQKG